MTVERQYRIKARLAHWYGLAEARHLWAGKAWYREAHEFACQLSKTYSIDLGKVVGVIAALSPSVEWAANKKQADRLCQAYVDGMDLEAVTLTTYRQQAKKARKILREAKLQADISEILGKRAFKTEAFYCNILGYPQSASVTIDQHIIAAAGFEDCWTQGALWCYNLLERVITELATEYGLKPFELQAIIWVTYKDLIRQRQLEAELPF